MKLHAVTSSLFAHALLVIGLFWVAGGRSVALEQPTGPMMVDLVAASAGTEAVQPVAISRVEQRPVIESRMIEPTVASDAIDDRAEAVQVVVSTEAPPVDVVSDTGIDAPAAAVSLSVADDAWAEFYAAVRAAIERAKRYPPSARLMGQEDRVVLSFLIAPDGRVGELRVVAPSRFPILNRAAIETIQRVAAFPHPPADAESAGVRVQVPMVFALHNEGAGIE